MSVSEKHERACLALKRINIILDLGITFMKITDILVERKINEAPVGMIKRAGLGIASKFGSDTAKGALDTAEIANGLKKAYNYYLGQSGQKPDSESLIAFFQQNGLSTDGVEKAIQNAVPGSGVKFMPGRKMTTRAAQSVSGAINKVTDKFKPKDAAAEPDKVEPNLGNEPTQSAAAPTAPTTDRSADDDMMQKLKTGALKSKLKGGRGIAKQTPGGFSAAVKAGQAKGLNMSHVPGDAAVMEVNLQSSTVDKIILAAIQDNIKQGMGQQLSAVAGSGGKGADQSGGGAASSQGGDDADGFGSSFSQAFNKASGGMAGGSSVAGVNKEIGGIEGNLNAKALAQLLPNVDPNLFTAAVKVAMKGGAQKISQQQIIQLAQGFIGLLKADPQTTTKVMTMLKKVSVQQAD